MNPVFQYGVALPAQLPPWQNENPSVFITDDIVEVSAYATLQIQNINLEGLMIREGEVDAQVLGDFVGQLDGNLGHHPNENFRPYLGIIDAVTTVFDRHKPMLNGSAEWNIPVELMYEEEMDIIEAHVVQRYEIIEGNLIMSKGGSVLYQGNLPQA